MRVAQSVPNVDGAQRDVKVGGAVHTVGGSEEVGGGDESGSTEPGTVDEDSRGPGELSLLCCLSSDDERRDVGPVYQGPLHTTVSHLQLLLLACISLEDPPPHLGVVLPLPLSSVEANMARLIFTEVPTSGRPPDLLRS